MVKSKIDDVREKFDALFYKGYSDYKIAKELGLNHCTVFQYRKKHNLVRASLKEAKPVSIDRNCMEVLIGTLLGDGNLRINKDSKNPVFSCEHGYKQKEYCEHKVAIFSSLNSKLSHCKRTVADKRNGVFYESYICRLPSNPYFLSLYNSFYHNKKKVIPMNLIKEYFTEKSLAYLFMDDGSKLKNGYTIATNCFTEDEVLEFRKFLFNKFNIETSMFASHVMYIKAKSVPLFTSLISPYIIDSMQYKLHKTVS